MMQDNGGGVSGVPCTNMNFISPSHPQGKIRMFDCTICRGSLEQPGPPLESFSFGKLLMTINQLSFSEQDIIYREFNYFDQCFSGGYFDCSKLLSTACGHLFHSGCIREWFFMRRLDRIKKCPFCNQRTNYEECWVIHATACNSDDFEEDDDSTIRNHNPDEKHEMQPNISADPEYSDISIASSSFSSDGSEVDESEIEDPANDDELQHTTTNAENNTSNADDIHQAELESQNYIITRMDIRTATDEKGFIKQALHFIDKFNIPYTWILRSTIRSACRCSQVRKQEFLKILGNVEDEDLVEEEGGMVPLGYDFIAQLMATALLIWFIEKLRNTFRKK